MPDRRYSQRRVDLPGGGCFIRLVADPPPRTAEEMREVLLESHRLTRETGLIVVADIREQGESSG